MLHKKIDLNLHLVERTSKAANFLNVSEMETCWINFVVIGLFVVNNFLRHNINIFIHIFFIQLYWFEKRFSHHSKLRFCTTKELKFGMI